MFDIIAALILGAIFTVDVIVLINMALITQRNKVIAYLVAFGWATAIVAIAALGGFAPDVIKPIPGPVLLFGIVLLAAIGAWFLAPAFRRALLSIPISALVGINSMRILGVLFLLLHSQGRLSAPFAPSAGWGDIVTGLAAIPLAAMLALGKKPSKTVLASWNAFGALDLIVAVSLAFFSAAGSPYRIFMDGPGSAVLTTLPWLAVPTLLVPLYLICHLIIAARLVSSPIQEKGRFVHMTSRTANV